MLLCEDKLKGEETAHFRVSKTCVLKLPKRRGKIYRPAKEWHMAYSFPLHHETLTIKEREAGKGIEKVANPVVAERKEEG